MEKEYDDEIEIDLVELLYALRRKLIWICLAGMICGAAAFGYTRLVLKPMYQSTTTMLVLTKETTLASLADLQMGTQLTKDYEELILGRTVLEKVIAQYQLDESYESLKKRVSVENTTNTRIISITVKDPNPANAQIIANSIRDVAAVHIKDVTDVEAVNVADEANLPE